MAEIRSNIKYRDRLFVWLFGKEERKQNILELYNALNHTHYKDVYSLEINTIENAVYITMHNDVSFLIEETMMNLWEEQSTPNPNMPVRGLLYLAQLYSEYIEKNKLNLYGESKFMLPAAQYVVFYLGEKDAPDRMEMKLADSFPARGQLDFTPCIDMTALMLNVNVGHNSELLEACRILREYSEMVRIVREYTAGGLDTEVAISKAVEECIRNNILREELREHKAEVIGMLLAQYDENKIRELFVAEGEAKGRAEGQAEGEAKGKVIELASLVHDGILDMEYAEKRAEEHYGIPNEKFQEIVRQYGLAN